MNILHIKCFWEAVNTGNFSEAAERLFVTQSTVSKNIAALEKELGFVLFERQGRGVRLTAQGKMMLEYFEEILLANERAEDMVRSIKKSGTQRDVSIRLSLTPIIEQFGMITAINKFAVDHPNIKVVMEVADERQVLKALESGGADIVFCSDTELDSRLYDMRYYSEHKFRIVVSKSNPLSSYNSISLKNLKEQKMIFLHQDSMLWNLCVDACEKAGFYPDIELTSNRPGILLEYVRSSNCVYMAIDLEVLNCPKDLYHVINLEDSPVFSYVFAWKKNKNLSSGEKQFLYYFLDNKKKYF